MSTKLTDLKFRINHVAEYRENTSVVIANEAIKRIEDLEKNLEIAITCIADPDYSQEAMEKFLDECKEMLA